MFFSSCDSVRGNALEFQQAKRGALPVCLGTWNSLARKAGELGLNSQRGGSLMGFLDLRQESWVYSRVMT